METLLTMLTGWALGKSKNTDEGLNVKRLDDKNYLVNGELVSFEEDTSSLRSAQELEDHKHYYAYERARLHNERNRIQNEWLKTTKAMWDYPESSKKILRVKALAVAEEHEEYLNKCEKLGIDTFILSREEYFFKKENPHLCNDFTDSLLLYDKPTFYHIHNPKTARYAGGNMGDLIRAEFKEKWF